METKRDYQLSTAVLFDDKLEIEQIQVPLDDTWRYARNPESVLEIDLNANREELLNRFSQAETFQKDMKKLHSANKSS